MMGAAGGNGRMQSEAVVIIIHSFSAAELDGKALGH